jgi:hypothetical protein
MMASGNALRHSEPLSDGKISAEERAALLGARFSPKPGFAPGLGGKLA